jgi:perosamine synthetase
MVLRDDLAKNNIRDMLIECLKQSNIECRPFFYPVHKLPPYFVDETLGIAEYLSQNGINVPSYVDIEVDDIKKICEQIRELINRAEFSLK